MDTANIKCPSCGSSRIENSVEDFEIPYFGQVSHYSLKCNDCGYKINDFAFSGNNPKKSQIKIEGKDDLFTKIVRGNQATVSIPELGLNLYPGPVAETFITNIEGLLERFLNVLPLFEDNEKVRKKKEEIDRAKDGKIKFTVIIDDPSGVSHFIPDRNEQNTSLL